MPKYPDPVEVVHPDLDGIHVIPRNQLTSLSRRGWVEADADIPVNGDPQTAAAVGTEPPAKGAAKEKK